MKMWFVILILVLYIVEGQHSSTVNTLLGADKAWGFTETPPKHYVQDPNHDYLGPNEWYKRHPFCGGTAKTGKRKEGNRQSPINFCQVPVDLNLKPISTRTYLPFSTATLQLVPEKQFRFVYDSFSQQSFTRDANTGISYSLMYISFVTPSEHQFGGAPRDFEVRFVHTALESSGLNPGDKGFFYVISVTYTAGEYSHSGFLENIITGMIDYFPPEYQNGSTAFTMKISQSGYMEDALPVSRNYYYYVGSVTYPPCIEGVVFAVFADPVMMSNEQLNKIHALLGLSKREDSNIDPTTGNFGRGNPDLLVNIPRVVRSVGDVPPPLQPLSDEKNIYSQQLYKKTNDYLQRKREFTKTEIYGVRMFKDYLGDEITAYKVKPILINEHAASICYAAIVVSIVAILLAALSICIARA